MSVLEWANSVDPDQTAPREAAWSGSTLFAMEQSDLGLHCLPFYLHRLDAFFYEKSMSQILGLLQYIFWVSEFLGVLWEVGYLKITKKELTNIKWFTIFGNPPQKLLVSS